MQERSAIQKGWEFSARLAGADAAARLGSAYVSQVEQAIDQLTADIVKLKSGQTDAVLGGYIAEHWHAGTFNVNAVAAGSSHRAFTLESTEYASVDIGTNFGKDYSAKYMSTPEKSAVAQGAFSPDTGAPKYQGQERLIPTDHMEGAAREAARRAAKNVGTRPEVAAAYSDAEAHLTDVVSDGEGVESVRLSKEDDLEMARRVKRDEFDPEDFGVSVDNAIKAEYILKKAMQAGATAAAITVAIQMAPEIYKAIDYLIKTGQINVQHLKKMGTNGKAFQTYLDVQSKFERYSVSNALLVAAQKPEATDLGDANFWRGRGGYIRKGESGILLMEPGNSYTRKDGSKGVNIHIKRVFDISQTTLTPTKQPAVSQDTRLLLNAMVRYAPCKVDFRDELPDGQSALYSPQEKTVFVRRGQSMEDVFRGVAQELAHAYLDTGNYSRENNIFLAQCVGNMLCQRNGIDGNSLAVTQLPQKYTEMEPKQLREELKSIRTAANQISADMFRFLDAKSHGSRQRDDAR